MESNAESPQYKAHLSKYKNEYVSSSIKMTIKSDDIISVEEG